MPELERQLHALGAELAYPPTPDLAARVGARLGAVGPAPVRLPLGRALAFAALWLLATAGTVIAASREVADAVLDTAGLSGVTIERTEAEPPTPAPRDLELGSPTSLADASDQLSFALLVPQALGEPDEVYARADIPGGELNLIYEPHSGLPPTTTTGLGLLVTEFRGDLIDEYLTKIAPETTTIERLEIGGRRAVWISGAPHFFFYDAPGSPHVVTRDLLVAQNVLLIQQGDVLVRMEGAFDRETAIRLAGTLGPLGL